MADNMIELVAKLDTDASERLINSQISDGSLKLDTLNIKCVLDTDSINKIKSTIGNLSKDIKLNVGTFGDTKVDSSTVITAGQNYEKATNKVLTLKRTLTDLDAAYTKPFEAVLNVEGLIDAERTLSKIQTHLSELGTVSVTGKYDDKGSIQSLSGITAEIKSATGEVRRLNFEWSEFDEKFYATTGSYNDRGVGKMQQDIARLSKELANFEASHKSIESGLTTPLKTARDALIDLESGVGSVEATQKAIDNLKTTAANISANLKSTGSSFNVFDNAINKAENFENILKSLEMDVTNLGASNKKSTLVDWISQATEGLRQLHEIESQSGRGQEWSAQYKQVSTIIQDITNNLKVAQKEDSAFNKEFNAELKAEEKAIQLEEKRVAVAKELREQQQHDYWQGRFEETIKSQTAENQVLKDMKKYYEEYNKSVQEAEKQQRKAFQEDNRLANLQNRIKRLTATVNAYGEANKRATESMKQMSSGTTFASEWSRITSAMAKGADLTDRELKDLSADMAVFRKEAQAAGLAGESAFGKFLNSFKVMSSYITANMVFNFAKRQLHDMVNEVTAVDTAMTELRKVTEATDTEFEAFTRSAGQTGRTLGASVSDVINATATFARLGETLPDAEELGRVATLYKNVGDSISEETAAEDIISTMKAFKIEAKDAISIVDKFNEVDTCPFYILIERNRRHIFPNCWEILKSFSSLFSER